MAPITHDEQVPPRRALVVLATLLGRVVSEFGLDLDTALALARETAQAQRKPSRGRQP